MAYPTIATTLGHNRVNCSDDFNALVAITSKKNSYYQKQVFHFLLLRL